MSPSVDFHVECARIQNAIESRLAVEGDLVFDFLTENSNVKLNLITVNSRHNQSFLFHSVVGIDKIDALKKMLAYVESYRESENSYTIQWTARNNRELHTSYFRAKSIYEALDKLYYGREVNSITVYSVVMNPIA
jgi:carbamoylphosphate synthase large subunit